MILYLVLSLQKAVVTVQKQMEVLALLAQLVALEGVLEEVELQLVAQEYQVKAMLEVVV
jgi:hypothetical protein